MYSTVEVMGDLAVMMLLPGMIQFDMTLRTFSNNSGNLLPGEDPLYWGAMEDIPVFGPKGLLMVMGGNDNNSLIDFGSVRMYDIAAMKWYNQTTTGDKPEPRRESCTAGLPFSN